MLVHEHIFICMYVGCVVLLCLLVVCMTLLASFFLPSVSVINMYIVCTCTCTYMYIHVHVCGISFAIAINLLIAGTNEQGLTTPSSRKKGLSLKVRKRKFVMSPSKPRQSKPAKQVLRRHTDRENAG